MKLRIHILVITLAGLFNSLQAQDFQITYYSANQKLPAYTYYDVIQTNEGELLFASEYGLVRYDAEQFILSDSELKIDYPITKFTRDKFNNIWLLPRQSDKPIKNLTGDSLKAVNSPGIIYKASALKTMVIDYDNDKPLPIVLNEGSRIFKFNGSEWILVKTNYKNIFIRDLIKIDDKTYAVTNLGLHLISGDELVPADEINRLLPTKNLLSIYEDKTEEYSRLWLFTQDWLGYIENGVFKQVSADFTIVQYRNNEDRYMMNKIFDRILFGSRNTVFQFNTSTREVEDIDENIDLDLMGITAIYVDYEQNLWFTSLRGIYKVKQIPFRNYTSGNGLKYNEVTAIEKAGENKIAVGQPGNLAIFNTSNGNITNYKFGSESNELITFSRIWDMFYDSNKSLWIVEYANGLGVFNGSKINWINNNGIEDFISTTQDNDNKNWFCTTSAVYRLENNKLVKADLPDSLVPRKLFRRKEGGIYIASTNTGVYTYNGKELKNFQADQRSGNNIYSICENEKYGTLIGTKAGLYQLKSNRLVKASNKLPRIDNPIYFIKNGKNNEIWYGTNFGVTKQDKGNYHHFILTDGLSGLECNRDAGYLDDSGHFWIGTNGGLSVYDDKYDHNSIVKPKGKIDFIQTGADNKLSPENEISIPYNQRNIFIKFSAFSYINERNNNFQVSLKHDDGSVIDSFTTYKTGVRFPSLAPGDYRFEMRVVNAKGNLSEKTYTARFSIGNPFYGQYWFYIVIIVITSVITGAIIKLYAQKKQSELLEEIVKQRTKELQEEVNEKSGYEAALRNSETRYKNLFQNSAFGIYQSTLDGKIILCNTAFQEMVGAKSLNEIKNFNIEPTFYVDSREDFINNIRSNGMVSRIEKAYKTLDNRIIWVRESARIILNQNNKQIIEGAIEDITATKEAEREMVLAKEKAEKSDRLKSEFLAQMSHEIRTPINTILSFSSLLKEELLNDGRTELESYFTAINHGSDRLIRTIDSILNLSQLQLGNYEAKFEKIDLFETVTGVLEEFKVAASEKGLNLSIVHSTDNNFIKADSYSVSQLIANLVDNAIKYTEKGFIKINIDPDGAGIIKLTIEDSGVGMSKSFLDDLFKPFSQEETGYSRRYEGTGLGLSLVKKYCDLNNAKIEVESKKGSGSKFIILFNSKT